jgi:hypothetical protein
MPKSGNHNSFIPFLPNTIFHKYTEYGTLKEIQHFSRV